MKIEHNWVKMDEISLEEFVEQLKINKRENNQLSIIHTVGQADSNWIQKNDIQFLMSLIDSKQDAKCIMRIVSSYMPISEKPTLGDQIILLIDSFRNKELFPNGLTLCGKFNKEKRIELQNWWKNYQGK